MGFIAECSTEQTTYQAHCEDNAADHTNLFSRVSTLEQKAVAKSEMKLDLPSHATFYRFLERMREEDAALRLAKATQVSREVASIARTADIADNDLISSLQSMGAEAALNGNVKDATRLVMMACDIARKTAKSEELRIANEKLKIEQAKSAKAVEAVSDEKLTDEERVAKIKGIFGLR